MAILLQRGYPQKHVWVLLVRLGTLLFWINYINLLTRKVWLTWDNYGVPIPIIPMTSQLIQFYILYHPLSISQLSLWYPYDTSIKMLVQSLFSMLKSPSKNTAVLNTICHFIYTALSVGIPSSWIMIMCHMTISVGLPRLHHSCVRTHFRWRNHVKSHFWMVQSPCVSLQSPFFAGYNYNPTCFFCN
jgi:hypothetical protein